MHLTAKTLDDLLRKTYEAINQHGKSIQSTRGDAVELCGVLLELENPRARLSRSEARGTVFSCLGELLWYLSGTNSLPFIKYYIPKYAHESEDGVTIYGGYGPRLFDNRGHNQIENVVRLLQENHDTRRAVIQIFAAEDIARKRREVPCTCTIQIMVREGLLHMLVCMRSNDAYFGLPHDIFAFSMLQELFAQTLGVELGKYKHFAGSLHVYDSKKADVAAYLSEGYHATDITMPSMPTGDPRPSIKTLLKIERRLRKDKAVTLSEFNLAPYWMDLARLLEIFAASKRGSVVDVDRISATITSAAYRSYINDKRDVAQRRSSDAPELSLFSSTQHS